jgi:lysophospholipase L1-like esterase
MQKHRSGLLGMFFLVLGVALAAPATASAQKFFIKKGDRVVMMGDSITEQHLYSNYVEMWTVTRFPSWELTFRNVGIGGDRSVGGNSRFKRDVLVHKPTVLTVDFGMNDGGYQAFNEKLYDAYMKGLQGIADQAKKADVRVAWITPQPTERTDPGDQLQGYNLTLEKFSAGVEEIAKKNTGLFVDQFHPYLAVINKARKTDPKILVTGGDAVHPGPTGQSLMAASILKGMHFPTLVSKVHVKLEADKSDALFSNCKISDVVAKDNMVHFKRLDHALPYFPPDATGILKWSPILDEMNEYGLQVTGLKAGKYDIKLGGKKVAEYSADDLAKGVNLAAAALSAGPVADQVNKVWKAVADKNRYYHDQIFRGLILSGKFNQKVYEERMVKMPELDTAVRTALAMQPHLVEIVPAKE